MNKIRLITKRVILNRIIISQIYKLFIVHVLSLFKDVDECKPNPTELHVPTHVDHLPVHVIRDGQVLSVIKVHENELELKKPLFLRSVAGLKWCAFCAECCALLSFDANAE